MVNHPAPRPLTGQECAQRLASASIGRVVLSDNALPTALPVAYALDGTDILFRSSEGAKLEAARQGTVIAFEVDQFDELARTGWSVVVTGLATVVTEPAEIARADTYDIAVWVEPRARQYVRLRPSIVSGRRISDPAAERTG